MTAQEKWRVLLSDLWQVPSQDADLWESGKNFVLEGWCQAFAVTSSPADRRILVALNRAQRPLRLIEIARSVERSAKSVSDRMTRLWRLGLVRRPNQSGKDWEKWELGPQVWPFRHRHGRLFQSARDVY